MSSLASEGITAAFPAFPAAAIDRDALSRAP